MLFREIYFLFYDKSSFEVRELISIAARASGFRRY